MIIDVIQTKKELFESEFSIRHQEIEIGKMHLAGKLSSMEGKWTVEFDNHHINLEYGKSNLPKGVKTFRPYDITIDQSRCGAVYQTRSKDSFLKKYDFHQMLLLGKYYDLYPIGFGEMGAKNPIYCGTEQVGQINKECVVYNDLHNYQIYAFDNDVIAAIIFCCYMYVNAGFKPGVKTTMSVVKVVSKTTNKLLLSKYQPSFENLVSK